MTGVSAETLSLPLKPAWKFTAAKPIKATAVADAERAYVGDGKGVFFAIKLANGTKAWEFATKDAWLTGAWTPQIWRFPLPPQQA